MKQRQIILQNNIIDIYQKVLKNDKEKSQFLLKIFKFLLENEEKFETNDKINGIFLAIKPSLKIKEFDTNWGGKREGSGRKINGSDNLSINQDENQLDNQLEKQDENQVFSSSFKDIKNIKNIKNKSSKDNKDIEKEKEKEKEIEKDDFITYEYCKQIYTKANCYDFNIVKFFNYYKDKGIKKEQVEHLMNLWDMRDNQFKQQSQQSQKIEEKINADTFMRQLGVSEQDLKEYSDFKKRSENV